MSTVNINRLFCTDINHSSGTASLTINSNNYVRRRNLPLFYGWRDIGSEAWENFGGTPVVYTYNIASVNRGGHYNTSTGIWTCPLAGIYILHPAYLGGNTGNFSSATVYKNGINVTAAGVHHNVGNYWKTNSQAFAIECAVNDQLAIRMATGSTTVYGKEYSHLSIWYCG
jgi:hypothetical protein